MRRLAPLISTLLLLAVAACGGSDHKSTSATATTPSGEFPGVSGAFGNKPTLTFPTNKPGNTLGKKVLRTGTGAVISKGDLLVADYLGQIWQGKVFDNSYDRGQPAAFQIGNSKVIQGWDEGLLGVTAGSRVLLTIPPSLGYGQSGNTQAGIKGTDTLTFIVDVIATYPRFTAGDPKAAVQQVTTGPKVTGSLAKMPTVKVPKGTTPPSKETVTVLAKGSGDPVKAGMTIVQYRAVTWDGKDAGSTWNDGAPAGVGVGSTSQATPFDVLKGVPIGSRVLMLIPAQSGQKPATASVAVVVDVVAQPPTAKDLPAQ